MQKQTTLIAGGSGMIGIRLAEILRAKGHAVRLLSRTPKGEGQFYWDPASGEIDADALQGVDYVVNLAGAGIADKRWTAARKQELVESRVKSATLLYQSVQRLKKRPKAYLSASGIGYYGNSGERWMREEDASPDQSFLAECCQKWESAAGNMAQLGLRTVIFRIGVVLAKEGGALAEIARPLRFGLGAYFGDGKAWWSWVHLGDVCRAMTWGIEDQGVTGTFNLVSPGLVRGKDLVVATTKAMKQPAVFLPVPAFALRLYFGEMSAVILNSNRVSSEKLTRMGFDFKWPELDDALRDIFA